MTAPEETQPPPPKPNASRTTERQCLEHCPICRGAELLRAGAAPELRGQIDDVGREALLTLRALIDHYLERVDAAGAKPRVEEIPID